jgi:hypothetical protein
MARIRIQTIAALAKASRIAARLALGAGFAGLMISTAQAQSAPGTQEDEAIPTAAGAPTGGAPAAPYAGPLRLDDRLDDGGPGFLRPTGPCGGPAKTADGKTDKTPHGEVWAGVGTRGYREAGGAVCVPLSDKSALTIAVDAGQINGWGRRR